MKKTYVFFAFVFLLICQGVFAQNEKYQALFIYNFTKFIDWPQSYKSGKFRIGVYGSSSIISELKSIAQTKTVGSQQIEVTKVNTEEEASKCHMLYIPGNKSSSLQEIVAELSNKPLLIIVDDKGAAKNGAGISFLVQGGKQKFEINTNRIKSCGLKVDQSLINLGIEVN